MVTESIPDVEVVEAPEGEEVEAVEAEVDSPEGAEPAETPEETPEPDPLAELRAEFDAFRPTVVTQEQLQPISSNAGRVDGLQSELAEVAKRDPLAAVDPRIADLEKNNLLLIDALLAGDPDDAVRTALTAQRAQIAQSQQSRDVSAQVREQVAAALPQKTEDPEATAPDEQLVEVQDMSSKLIGYADGKGVDYASLAPDVLAFQPGESLDAAFTRVKSHIDGLADEAGATDRVTARAAAAGGGTPSRSGGASTIDDLLDKLTQHGPTALTEAENDRTREHLGVRA